MLIIMKTKTKNKAKKSVNILLQSLNTINSKKKKTSNLNDKTEGGKQVYIEDQGFLPPVREILSFTRVECSGRRVTYDYKTILLT